MDDDTRELIAMLCTRIGMIMEDASIAALSMAQKVPGQMRLEFNEIERAAEKIAVLVNAAGELLR